MSRLRFREPSPRFPEISPSRRRSPAQATNGVLRLLDFLAANIRNRNTREAYYRAACSSFAWLKQNDITELDDIEPMHVSLCVQTLLATAAKPTVKQHLAGIRHLFDRLVTGQILPANLAHALRGPKHVLRRGKAPFLTEDQARHLLADIDSSTVVGLRDRALIGMMAYTVARIGAVAGMRVEDHFPHGKRFYVRLHEKGGKQHEMPVHHKLDVYIDEFIRAAGIVEDERGPSSPRPRAKRAFQPGAQCTASTPTA